MIMNIYFVIACLLASAHADASLGLGGLGAPGLVYAPGHASSDYYSFPRYAFEYAVKDPHTGDNKAQWEKREGDVVKGAYSLVEPDGSLRVVEYWADDKSGFNAVVKRLGPSVHPTTVHAPPIYKASIPVLSHGPVASPISIGPVAQLGHLANAPLISGPAHGAVSSQSLVTGPLSMVKNVIPSAPIPEPLPMHPVPLITSPLLSEPIYKAGPIYSKPLGPPPSYKAPLPVYKAPLPIYNAPLPVYKAPLPVYKAPLPIYNAPLPVYKAPLPIYKEAPMPIHPDPINWGVVNKGPIAPWVNLEKGPVNSLELGGLVKGPVGPWEGLVKEPIGPPRPLDLHGYGLVTKGPIGPLPLNPGYEVIGGSGLPAWGGPLDYSLQYNH